MDEFAIASDSSRTKIRVAIADDHSLFRSCLRGLLVLEDDMTVVGEVSGGHEVPEVLAECAPDILLLDLNMPGLDGFGTLAALQKLGDCTKVIVLTGSEDHADALRALKLGASGVVVKQTATDVLVDSIRRVHDGGMALDSVSAAALAERLRSQRESQRPGPGAMVISELLTSREREITVLVAQGFKNREIAEQVRLSEQMVKNYLRSIFQKVGVSDRLALALYASDNLR
jgi:two-component system, NarL family, nitrate/nitrite response regulator NarL